MMRGSKYAIMASAVAALSVGIIANPLSAPIQVKRKEPEIDDAPRQRKRWLQRQARKTQRAHRK